MLGFGYCLYLFDFGFGVGCGLLWVIWPVIVGLY